MKSWGLPLLVGLIFGIIVWQASLVALPRVIMAAAIDRIAAGGGINRMRHAALATPVNQPIVRPSPDLAYSSCPFDVSDGPVRVHVMPAPARYSSLSVFDARTDVVFVRNDRQAGGKPFDVVIARPGQAVPAGVEVIRIGSDRGIALIRLLLANPAEIGSLGALRRQSWCAAI